MFRSSVSIDRICSQKSNRSQPVIRCVAPVLKQEENIMFDQSFSFILTIAALVVGIMLFTGHGSFFMKGGNTQARAQKYDEKKME